MLEKIEYFLNHLHEVLDQTNPQLEKIIEAYKKINVKNIEKYIAHMWIRENLGLFDIWNAAILNNNLYID